MSDNTIEKNLRRWDQDHHWSEDGDEWKGQAESCGKPYAEWKQSLIEHLIFPYVTEETTVLEIAPGHGRWSESILSRCRQLILVDLSPNCILHCRKHFSGHGNVEYYLTNGTSLPPDASAAVDFVWSFDSFVHMSGSVIQAYLSEIERVLVPGGHAVIHHAGRRHATLWLGFLKSFGGAGRRAYRAISLGLDEMDDGWRSNVSHRVVARMVVEAGLEVEKQINRWGPNRAFGVPRYRDAITIIRKPD